MFDYMFYKCCIKDLCIAGCLKLPKCSPSHGPLKIEVFNQCWLKLIFFVYITVTTDPKSC